MRPLSSNVGIPLDPSLLGSQTTFRLRQICLQKLCHFFGIRLVTAEVRFSNLILALASSSAAHLSPMACQSVYWLLCIQRIIQQSGPDRVSSHVGFLNNNAPSGEVDACRKTARCNYDFQNSFVVGFGYNASFFNRHASIYRLSVTAQTAPSTEDHHTMKCNPFQNSLSQGII